ncbi:hypothetical protein ABPG72_014008 [Tetrahymena utriculariae]
MQQQSTTITHIGWNIRGAPDNKQIQGLESTIINKKVKTQILDRIYKKSQNNLIFLQLLETNIKNNAKILWDGIQINNICTQKTAAGISLLINRNIQDNITKILNRSNDQQFQILMHIINKQIFRIIVSIHKQEHNKQQEKKLLEIVNQLKQFQENRYCCQIIIFADLNENILNNNKNIINKTFTKLKYQILTTIKPTHKRGNNIDYFIIYNNDTFQIQQKIINDNIIIGNQNNPSDHFPIQIEINWDRLEQTQIIKKILKTKTANEIWLNQKSIFNKEIILDFQKFNEQIQQEVQNSLTVFEPNIEYIKQNKQIYLSSQTDQLKELVNNYLTQKWKCFLSQTNELHKENKSKIFYQNVKKIYNLTKKGEMFSLQNGLLFDKNNLPTFGEQAMEIVQEYFENHFNSNNCYLPEFYKISDKEANDFLINIGLFQYDFDEISDGKGCSQDHVKDIIINSYSQNGKIQINNTIRIENIQNWIKQILTMPEKYQCNYQGRQVYLQKTETNRHPEYCRPITILPAITKATEQKILYNINETTKQLPLTQAGFCQGRSTTAQITKLISLLKYYKHTKSKNIFVIYYDFTGAFDTPSHSLAFEEVLPQYGVRNIDIQVIKTIYSNLKINGFRIGRGFLQGSPLSPKLFIIYLEHVLQKVEQRVRAELGQNFKLLYLAYADDLALVHGNIDELKIIDRIMRQVTTQYLLLIKDIKTKLQQFLFNNQQYKVGLNDFNYETVKTFRYLGFEIDNELTGRQQTQKIIEKLEKYQQLSKRISYDMKNFQIQILMWKTFIKAQFMYSIPIIFMIASQNLQKMIQNSYQASFRNISKFPNYISYKYINKIMVLDIDHMIFKYSQHIIQQLKVNQMASSESIQEREQMNIDWKTEQFFNFYQQTLIRMQQKYDSETILTELIKQQKTEYKKLNFQDSNKFYKYLYLLQNFNVKPFTDDKHKQINLPQVLQTINGDNCQWLREIFNKISPPHQTKILIRLEQINIIKEQYQKQLQDNDINQNILQGCILYIAQSVQKFQNKHI